MIIRALGRSVRFLASLKVAIPLLVLLTLVTVVLSLFPDTELFRSRWYLALLGALGLSLLLITILHVPSILRRKGRNALLGVVVCHLGILVVIAGIIHGAYAGFREEVRLVEGETTIVPGLPFVLLLEELVVERYRAEDFPRMNPAALPARRQESRITLLKQGEPWRTVTVAPGRPALVDGLHLVPSLRGTGRALDLIVLDPMQREKTVPVRPWAPPLIGLGGQQVMVHGLAEGEDEAAEVFIVEDGRMVRLGVLRAGAPLEVGDYSLALGPIRDYTGMKIYNRPQEPLLVIGSVLMFAGLLWHFYFRHRERRREEEAGEDA